ncbi:MAG: SecD/SecF family protein translocase subunit, partial [Gemmataceae bacterium]|nr:SecD/SecF family protein translocase subunit [Gemmataceae bacterium]
MKSFFWRFILCLVPTALAAWVSIVAVIKYQRGESGGFKFGVDLVGGTILVYEIDIRKSQEADKTFDANRATADLALSLKRRIDPNDLYNIVIRPAGGEGRVEIILPTGGIYRTKKAEKAWDDLLEQMKKDWELPAVPEVGRGKILELADRIQLTLSEKVWEDKLFNSEKNWKKLLDSTVDFWAELDDAKIKAEMTKLNVGNLKALGSFIYTQLASSEAPTSDKAIELWIKKQAWDEMLSRARAQWPFLAPFKEDMERITPDSVEQVITFIQAKGSVIGQAGLSVVSQLTGADILDGLTPPEAKEPSTDHKVVEKFVLDNYGPSIKRIQDSINTVVKKTGRSRDLSVEEVQRIKELVAKVGSLEFRILANKHDDKQGISRAQQTITDAKDLDERAKKGLPPPPPTEPDDPTKPGLFEISLPRNNKSIVSYSWVEIGPQERKALNLDNAARNDTTRNSTWIEAQTKINQATELKDIGGKPMLQGALFFARKCEDRNLPDEERRHKEWEYFVLTRDPEIDPADPTKKIRTPKLDGSYLVRAQADNQDLRPAVAFTFNTAGGELMGNITRKNVPSGSGAEESQIKRHLAIILDGWVMSAPTINSEIRTHGQISGSFTQKEVDGLVNILRAGQLPATLKQQPVSENTIGATLGQDTIESAMTAILLAFAVVLAFMVIYYRFAGFVASVALLANLILTVGFMVAVQATFTLPGLAGLVLMLGMAVDANVLIYERFREERERGATIS